MFFRESFYAPVSQRIESQPAKLVIQVRFPAGAPDFIEIYEIDY